MKPVAVVTGANRGLGLECARRLADSHRVLLAVRDPAGARAALDLVPGAELRPLDLVDAEQVARFAAGVDAVDVLINNAAVALEGFDVLVARRTMAVNVFGTIALTEALWPRLAPEARVVNVSSGMGELTCLAPALQARFRDPALDVDGIHALVREFLGAVERGRWAGAGWPTSAYRVSKAALNAYTRVLARREPASARRVNAVCPGWVRTRMGGSGAPRSIEQGARGIVWAARLLPTGPSGGFFRDGRPIPW